MSDPSSARTPSRLPRYITLLLVLTLIAAALYALFFTPFGHLLRHDREAAGAAFRTWVDAHHLVAPLILVALYVAAGVSFLPVWWIQILAGYGFGMWLGVPYSLIGATCAAVASFLVSRLLLADWVHTSFEARHAKLRELDEKMGHNGLLIVMASRLMHFLPFGVSNYLFGVTRITLPDVLLGTILGNAPAVSFYVAVGAGWQPLRDWRFMSTLAVLNVVLLIPVALRYWKPQWFSRIGIE
jgi:uncharacterized membrane protein YdjX (TVP38/TMEM64 family)